VVFSFEYIFYHDKEKISVQDFLDGELSWFLAALNKNGQLIDQHWNLVEETDALRLYCIAPDQDSLDSKYYNVYCQKHLSKLVNLSSRVPEYRLIGRTVGLSDSCTCTNPNYYILFTTFLAEYSPISCGDCNLPVPLYKLPVINEEKDYNAVLYWEETYQSCDTLFILSDTGERFGRRQISDINSSLSKLGIELCKEMALKAQKPFYYYLHKQNGRQEKVCPMCGHDWVLPSPLHKLYSYKCDHCSLVADRS
jgi:predicted  nucleic acid-binding Zn ribbon protein